MNDSTATRHLVVTGMPGVGKSTVTRELATRLGWPRRDSDDDIAQLVGCSGRELAARDGVAALHGVEAEVLLTALAEQHRHVIAAAASVIDDAACRLALDTRASLFVLVRPRDVPIDAVAGTDHRRPIDVDELARLRTRREPLWREHAVAVLTVDRDPESIADAILAQFR